MSDNGSDVEAVVETSTNNDFSTKDASSVHTDVFLTIIPSDLGGERLFRCYSRL